MQNVTAEKDKTSLGIHNELFDAHNDFPEHVHVWIKRWKNRRQKCHWQLVYICYFANNSKNSDFNAKVVGMKKQIVLNCSEKQKIPKDWLDHCGQNRLQYLFLPVGGSNRLKLHLSCREGTEEAAVAEAGAAWWTEYFNVRSLHFFIANDSTNRVKKKEQAPWR